MNPTPNETDASDQVVFWDAVWTLDDEWSPAPVVLPVIRPRTSDLEIIPEFLALL